jgi:hypothetical protein
MGDRTRVEQVRRAAEALRFESTSRGAVVLSRLRYDLPSSESVPGVADIDRAFGIIRRTISHSHATNDGLEQYGNGYWVMFSRHVTEGDLRWDFEVDVEVDAAGMATMRMATTKGASVGARCRSSRRSSSCRTA